MTAVALPIADYFSNPARLNSEAKTAQDATLAFLRQSIPGAAVYNTYTIASGTLTPLGTEAIWRVNTEASAATDDLALITQTNTVDGQTAIITPADAGRVVTVKHGAGGTGQILLKGDRDLVLDTETYLWLHRVGTTWVEVMRTPPTSYVFNAGTFGGSANALTASPNQKIGSYYPGLRIQGLASADNSSGTVTLNVSGLGNKTVLKWQSGVLQNLSLTEWAAGTLLDFVYDGTYFIVMTPKRGSSAEYDIGTSGAKVGLLNGNNTHSGNFTHTGSSFTVNSLSLKPETGTFSPTLYGSTTPGTVTWTLNTGRYLKIGNWVFLTIQIQWTNWTGSPAGEARIGNLPFVVGSSSYDRAAISVGLKAGLSLGGTGQLGGYGDAGNTYIRLATGAATSDTFTTVAEMTVDGTVYLAMTYYTP